MITIIYCNKYNILSRKYTWNTLGNSHTTYYEYVFGGIYIPNKYWIQFHKQFGVYVTELNHNSNTSKKKHGKL